MSFEKGRVRVLIVEDSRVVRELLAHIISQDPRLSLVGAVETAEEALAQLSVTQPDVISMDIRLPGMDGLEATRRIMAQRPTPIVVIAGSIEDQALQISMSALRAGALSVVEKPVGTTNANYQKIAETITTQLYIMSQVAVIRRREGYVRRPTGSELPPVDATKPVTRPAIIGMAASTGGPPALAQVLGTLPRGFPVPIVLVQHMGPSFMEGFASWLRSVVKLDVTIAEDGIVPSPGTVYVAPGDRHLVIGPQRRLAISDAAPYNGQRPSANLLFKSIARGFGAYSMGILLTGMGEDGAEGLAEIRQAGGFTIAEHESTAVVYGMPAVAIRRGAASVSLPLGLIGPRLISICEGVT
ncbi:two-component system chemotaxis response regulator CheB [Rhodoligotrophos appendicifer]|uniref:chemotaxis-specific protein-glutamate methyltransferase CheB n=1 Tax=Rhodoligotrophos appendicifer TaxID=987056 RepID=UPI0011864225|nr:chemotaxis-specific protein-glutamate methyltransferase CheB [Rhodoligotrophos appendicifer]